MRGSRRLTGRWALALAIVCSLAAASAAAQRWRMRVEPNAAYDGRFTFVRLRYLEHRGSGWAADYPEMERNFMTLLNELSSVGPHVRESNVLLMDDPGLSKYPAAYISEPGYWYPNESEAQGLRTWIQKGGFLWVDDFYNRQWEVFERAMRMVLPDANIVELDVSHPIFHSFFEIQTLEGMSHPDNANARAKYLGIYEDNDPSKRLAVIISYNNDIGDYMERSDQGWYPVNMANDAYKLATNFIVYGLTH